MDERANERANEQMNERANERTNERTNEWTNERVESLLYLKSHAYNVLYTKQLITYLFKLNVVYVILCMQAMAYPNSECLWNIMMVENMW